MTVLIDDSAHATLFTDPNRPDADEWLTLEGLTVFTNPLNGETVVVHFAGARRSVFPGEPGREIDTDIGGRGHFVHQGSGGLLARDAGYAVIDFTLSIVGGEIVLQRGPHPVLAAVIEGDDPFCGLVTGALGLTEDPTATNRPFLFSGGDVSVSRARAYHIRMPLAPDTQRFWGNARD